MEIIILKYTVAGDHLENIWNRMAVRRVKISILWKRPEGHAVPHRLAQGCSFGKNLICDVSALPASKLLDIKLGEELLGDPHFGSIPLANNSGINSWGRLSKLPGQNVGQEQPVTAPLKMGWAEPWVPWQCGITWFVCLTNPTNCGTHGL